MTARTSLLHFFTAAALAAAPLAAWAEESPMDRMMAEIQADMASTAPMVGRASLSTAVAGAIRLVPRHRFVPQEYAESAYVNRPLPIGYGQTISQPYIVALMTELVDPAPDHKTLEIGTGSGYQAAVLALLVKQVFTIEIVPKLAEDAKDRLERLGYKNVTTRTGDGYNGWEENAPFDSIVVTAAADHIPPPLIRQLKPGGKMIIPVGSSFLTQNLILAVKDSSGQVSTRHILPVRFVPLTRSK